LLDNPVDYANLGWTYYNAARSDMLAALPADAKPKLEKAKTALQKALTGPPAIHDGVLQNLGAVQIDLGDFRGAIESLKPVTEHKPDWVFSKYALGTAYFKVNDFAGGKDVRAALEKDPALSSLGVSRCVSRTEKKSRGSSTSSEP
jgi:tetratricopeptide (TPR) repeat protein